MRQLVLKKGEFFLEEVPVPTLSKGMILVKNTHSCISTGTEMSSLTESAKPLYQRLIDNPEKIGKAIQIIKNNGLTKTMAIVNNVLATESPVGYSSAGQVIEAADDVHDIQVGDRVACAGGGFASHAEINRVPRNLVVKVPDNLELSWASTVALGAIAIQGIRRANPLLGETFVVLGLGILGQLTAQLLRTNGCRVIGLDLSESRTKLAKKLGMEFSLSHNEDLVSQVYQLTDGYGADGVMITASTRGDDVVSSAFKMCRKKGRVIIVGDVGLDIKREDIYSKELDIFISTSYGPGRYDNKYEEKGIDYPVGYVRWTENRNMSEYIRLLSERKVVLDELISNVFLFNEATKAYQDLRQSNALLNIFKYDEGEIALSNRVEISKTVSFKNSKLNIAVVGVGEFAKTVHLPNLKKLDDKFNIYAVMSRNGLNAKSVAKNFDARFAVTSFKELVEDSSVDAVFLCTRHNTHASMAMEAARAGKAVFLEKPMAMNHQELEKLVTTLKETKVPFTVGFNRRFSVYAKKIKEIVSKRNNPFIINYRMNAGFIPRDHWVHSEEGGGRNIGEACHIYDLFNFLTDSEVLFVSATAINPLSEHCNKNDNFVASIKYKDGSVCNLIYSALGAAGVSKEQMEVFVDGKILRLDDYKKLEFFGTRDGGLKTKHQDKGHYEELVNFAKSLGNGDGYPIPLWQLVQATGISFNVERCIYDK